MEKRELIILGMGATRRLCPFDGVELWSVNTGYMQIAEINEQNPDLSAYLNKVFLAHIQHQREDDKGLAYSFEQFNLMTEHGIEIINTHRCKGLKSKLYPFKRIVKKFNTEYFSNTICYMLAYAIDQATVKSSNGSLQPLQLRYPFKIRFYGVDMLTYDEYEWEKGGLEYWMGKAESLGIEIDICNGSTLKTTVTGRPYGQKFFKIGDVDPFGLTKKIKKLSKEGLVDLVDGKGELVDPETLETYD